MNIKHLAIVECNEIEMIALSFSTVSNVSSFLLTYMVHFVFLPFFPLSLAVEFNLNCLGVLFCVCEQSLSSVSKVMFTSVLQ
jgi:hypothetical protein